MSDPVTITSGGLTAQIDPFGAELISLKDKAGREYMSEGDPAFWTGRAPILFPIVGGLNGGTYRHKGREYALARHGFARKSGFALVEQSEREVTFRLADNAETRAVYPFAFELTVTFALDAEGLTITAKVRNTGDTPMPFSIGYHPAFAWPLPEGGDKLAHTITFAEDEPAGIRRLDADGLMAASEATPVADRILPLSPDLFESDAIIWDKLHSESVTYRSPNGPALEIAWESMPYLGIWQKPGAHFICIEPWAGHADPAGFGSEISEKPGIVMLRPGEHRAFPMAITLISG